MIASPVCVYRAGREEEAHIVAAWLAAEGIDARVFQRDNPGVMAFGITNDEGIAVCVSDATKATDARRLIEEHRRAREESSTPKSGVSPVEVVCEDCGGTSRFRLELRGTVAECEACGGYVDVPI